jgi:peroxiredoxin (alkyl hydroperoxide reductase subunit C)
MNTKIKKLVLIALMICATDLLWSQNAKHSSRIPLLNEPAPSFTAESTKGTINFPGDYGHKWKILFSHPADYTPVCTSELMELAKMQQDFKDLNVEIAVVSTNPLYLHKAWVASMEEMLLKDNNPVKINFPLIDDSKLNVGWKYGMLTPSHDSFKAIRGVYIIDPNDKIKAISFYPMEVGRNMEEIKRMVIALQTAEKNTVLLPANWKPGDDVLLPYPKASTDDKSDHPSGYMLYTKLGK